MIIKGKGTPTQKEVMEVLNKETSKSSKIRELFTLGVNVSNIAKLLEIRYQFANNIINQYILKENIEVVYEKKQIPEYMVK